MNKLYQFIAVGFSQRITDIKTTVLAKIRRPVFR